MKSVLDMFQLEVKPLPNATHALTVLQRPFPAVRDGRVLPLINVGSIDGLALSSVWDIILDVLRTNHYKPVALQSNRKTRLALSEESGVQLSVLFKVLSGLSNLDQIRAQQQAIWAMSPEEAYYWFAKCYGPYGDRGVQALRILHAPLG